MTDQIKYQEITHKYRLVEAYSTRVPIYPDEWIRTDFITLSPSGDLMLANGYACDGPSGPTVDTKGAMRGAFCHDGLYQLIRLGLLDPMWRARADAFYEDCLRKDAEIVVKRDLPRYLKFAEGSIIRLAKFRAEYQFKALRMFGGAAAEVGSEPPILTAP